ncbi:nucleoside deaminase [Halobium salinum]|uniref:Nucleoside deaminase n=1 Tax=Halobium salinum TaxID=1364940 RepID=A0ABD5PH24_9EURY|nr:nucleoside deaminase [Halobium salinum]
MEDAATERHLRRCLDLAREAAAAGDEPFGSLLVRDGEVIREALNRVHTEDDIRAHPELELARWAARELDADARAETTMYTSTEPCPMCSGGMRLAGLGGVVYSVSHPALADLRGTEPHTRAATVLGDDRVEGPVLLDEGLAVHEAYW